MEDIRIVCPRCDSIAVKATGSAQMRQVGGEKRLTADMVCPDCGHQWWSVNKAALEMSRAVDQERKDNATVRD